MFASDTRVVQTKHSMPVFVLAPHASHGVAALALLRGSAVNQDGRSSGLTAPNGPAQAVLIADAIATCRSGPNSLNYISTHGTGAHPFVRMHARVGTMRVEIALRVHVIAHCEVGAYFHSADGVCAAMNRAGTPLGDPIEISAIGTALRGCASASTVGLGSAKSCFGHTEGSAGVTGMRRTQLHCVCKRPLSRPR